MVQLHSTTFMEHIPKEHIIQKRARLALVMAVIKEIPVVGIILATALITIHPFSA